jgi:plasmid replication initiation protein
MSEPNLLELIINKDNTVTKSNLLIEAEYKLTASEFKLIQTVFSNIQPGDKIPNEPNTYIFPIKQFLDLLDLKGRSAYSELEKITLKLYGKPFQLKIDNKTAQVGWFSYINYDHNKGTITIRIDKFWNQYLFSLENNFTSYKLFNISNLKSAYSLRLYELLKSRINLNSVRTISLEELRAKMGIAEELYPKYANFKQRVILQAQKELLAESDIYFEFKEIKKGRSVDKIEFHIYRNGQKEPTKKILLEEVMTENPLSVFGLTDKVIDELTIKYPQERIVKNIEYVNEKMAVGEVNIPAAYIKKAIEDDYATSRKKPAPKDVKKLEQAKKLKRNTEETEKEQYERPIEEIEYQLLEAKKLKERLNVEENLIKEEIFKQIMDFQRYNEKNYSRLISPTKFKDIYLQNICKAVIQDYYATLID